VSSHDGLSVGNLPSHGTPRWGTTWMGGRCGVTPALGNTIQISLYGLFGTKVQGLVGGVWWVWAFVAWLLVLGLGQYPGRLVARVLGVLLALEVGLIGLFIVAGFTHPASGSVSPVVFAPSRLLVPAAVAGVIVFAVASFAGVESVLAFAEEATSDRYPRRARRPASSTPGSDPCDRAALGLPTPPPEGSARPGAAPRSRAAPRSWGGVQPRVRRPGGTPPQPPQPDQPDQPGVHRPPPVRGVCDGQQAGVRDRHDTGASGPPLQFLLRHEALCYIPGIAGRDSEEYPWVR
jgi:hypothetical protein